jgi:sensor domain CHASE-containing protein
MAPETRGRLVATGLVVAVAAALAGAAAWIISERFAVVEEDGVRRNLARARTAVEDYLVVLQGKAGDWAQWDESYEFVVHPTTEWTDTNVPTNSLVQLDLNLVVFLDTQGRTVFVKAGDAATGNPIAVPPPFDSRLPPGSPLLPSGDEAGGVSGAVMVGNRCLFAAARPILRSDGHGPARGTLIFGRFVDDAFVERLRAVARLDLAFHPFDAEPVPADFRRARDELKTFDDVRIEEAADGRLAAFGLLPGLDLRPILVARVQMPRHVRDVARSATVRVAGAAAITAVIFGSAAFLLVGARGRREQAAARHPPAKGA